MIEPVGALAVRFVVEEPPIKTEFVVPMLPLGALRTMVPPATLEDPVPCMLPLLAFKKNVPDVPTWLLPVKTTVDAVSFI